MIDVQVRQPASAFSDLLFSQIEITKMIKYARAQSERLPNVRAQRFNRALGSLQDFGVVAHRPERYDAGSACLFGQTCRCQCLNHFVYEFHCVAVCIKPVAETWLCQSEFSAAR